MAASSSLASTALLANHSVLRSQRLRSTWSGYVPIMRDVSHLPAWVKAAALVLRVFADERNDLDVRERIVAGAEVFIVIGIGVVPHQPRPRVSSMYSIVTFFAALWQRWSWA